MMRFADALKGGLLGAITGKDFSQGVIPGLLGKDMSGGIAGMLIGDSYPSLTNIQKSDGIFGKLPSTLGQGPFSHGFGDYDGDGFYKGDIGGGAITEAEKRKIVGGAYQLL
tara:strand:+ start:73 stop:405 length:333 start_codon:yes stop_codon:yes gene_type:complete